MASRRATRRNCPECKELLYFGADRFDASGDCGSWLLVLPGRGRRRHPQARTEHRADFTGRHEDGDLLILSDFSNGGDVSTISVYQWDSTGASRRSASSNSANCNTAPDLDDYCGIVNGADDHRCPGRSTDKTWRSRQQGLNGEFFEGGVDLTALGLGDRCFSSFAAETRSSTSTTATLKDFIIGGFGACTAGMKPTPVLNSDGSALPAGGDHRHGTAVKDSAKITVRHVHVDRYPELLPVHGGRA